jgi:D-alanyl-D-alanine carboxypeptidase
VLLTFVLLALVAAGSVAAARHFLVDRPAAAPATKPKPAARKSRPKRAQQPPAPRPPLQLLSATQPLTRHSFDPGLSGSSAILIDADSGTVLWAQRPHQRHLIASTTKIMTGILALEQLRLRTIVRVNEQATRAAPNREGLRVNEPVRAWKLLYGLLLYSGNDDAVALAIASAGSRGRFIDEMNAKARRLGMHDTHFSTPSGVVDKGNYSSAWDMAALARYALENARFAKIVATRRVQVPWAAPTFSKVYVNKNALLGSYRGADGVKTGWTTLARHCLVASAHRGKVHLIAVVLHSENPFGDARRLLNLGFRVRG